MDITLKEIDREGGNIEREKERANLNRAIK